MYEEDDWDKKMSDALEGTADCVSIDEVVHVLTPKIHGFTDVSLKLISAVWEAQILVMV